MAVNQAAWSLDIGMSALKALCLRYAEEAEQAVAVAFDYIEHPKILSQPDADADALIREALQQFLDRNDVKGAKIALAVPGQAGLVRFVKLPPVEPSRMSEIVRYEARQQIPFALEEVIWDYQKTGSTSEIEGFALDTEVGLFAMKRDQVLRHLNPLTEAGVEIDLIQMSPIAMYNCIAYDRLSGASDAEGESGEKEFVVLLDIGADNSNLVVTDGDKVWQRNVPIGGNHFTRALTKQLKLTFAKAEHIKRNATKTKDPRVIFQAMRPVFNDFMTEVQRSVGYFASVNRNARIARIIGMGGGFKLPGLQKFLSQNLQYPVEKLSALPSLAGDAVLAAPAFKEQIMSFPVCYGLGLQALEQAKIRTSLLPPEIVQERTIRAKKPWAMAAAATVLLGATVGFLGWLSAYKNTSAALFEQPEEAAKALTQKANGYRTDYERAKQSLEQAQESARAMVAGVKGRHLLPEVLQHLNRLTPLEQDESKELSQRDEITVPVIDVELQPDLSVWAASLGDEAKNYWSDKEKNSPPSGEGYLITLQGYHFHNNRQDVQNSFRFYVEKSYLRPLKNDPGSQRLGLSHATIINSAESGAARRGAAQPQQGRGRQSLRPMGQGGGSPAARGETSEGITEEYTTFTVQLVFLPDNAGKGGPGGPAGPGTAPAVGPANANTRAGGG